MVWKVSLVIVVVISMIKIIMNRNIVTVTIIIMMEIKTIVIKIVKVFWEQYQ